MEIDTHQLEALLQTREQQAQSSRQQPAQSADFEALLNRQIGVETAANVINPAASAQAAALNALTLENSAEAAETDPTTAVLQAAFDDAYSTLDIWDAYSKAIGGSTDRSLRDAYSMLESVDARVEALKANPLAGNNAALDGIINELEIMAVTEKFKFNRGDYLA